MGYKGIFIVYDKDGAYLGRYPGWTSEEAIEKAQKIYTNRQMGKTKFCGTLEEKK